ncbi:alpha/beta hydrolase [Chlorogloeopsis sp. ULAP01]|uniref:alpha/beta fold hydrolase n=1 Tax=Chlorogloeopsis sp. ULAP01 TaxID=3056483 RepID=UPI0025AAED29|nr:alpha/beta hydrolase [Chlorogloeopsis sp. ULAP01]MDM9385102.1 alpha/beta hydrolase [Chlorogloeopsis sp. ULAP01]
MSITKVELKPCFLTPRRLQPEYPLFVYLPGMDGTGQLLRTQTVGLEAGFDVRCLAIPREDLTSWEVLTNNVLDLIHAELEKSSQRSVYLCGESFGGCLAQKVAVAAPQLFKRIILVNPASSFHLRPLYEWASQFTNLVPSCLFDFGAVGFLPFLAALSRISRSDRHEMLRTIRSIPAETVCWRLSLIKEFHVDEEELRRLTQPVLLVASVLDRLLPSLAEAQRLVNILPESKLVLLPESGHACLLETDINLYEIMKAHNFLERGTEVVKKLEVKS